MDDKLFILYTMISFIILTLVVMNGFYLYRKSKIEELKIMNEIDRLEFDKYKFNESEYNKCTYLIKKLEYDIERDKKQLELEYARLNNNQQIDIDKDFTQIIYNYIIMSVDPFILKNYVKGNKPLDECEFGDITIPSGEKLESDQNDIVKEIELNIPDFVKEKFDRLFNRDRWLELLRKTTTHRFNYIIRNLRENLMELARQDNLRTGRAESAGKKVLFINNEINPSLNLSKEVIDAIKLYNIKNIKGLVAAQNYLNDNKTRDVAGAKELLSINVDEYVKEEVK